MSCASREGMIGKASIVDESLGREEFGVAVGCMSQPKLGERPVVLYGSIK
jgi:hypothetical protein